MASRKRPPDFIPNPFIKKRNLNWSLQAPPETPINPDGIKPQGGRSAPASEPRPTEASTAAIESGAVIVEDHVLRFSELLQKASIPHLETPDIPRISIPDYKRLYESNAGSKHGAHFVIHQHDHPVAGTHYDLRLQINETSSVSWAIMYGVPGNPNSTRLNRNATETRIHSLWNHLIETASRDTGSLLIWDTGTYQILPRRSKYAPAIDPSSQQSSQSSHHEPETQQQLLHDAFQNRKIRLQLHGTRLPEPYVIYLRLTKSEDVEGRQKANRPPGKRRRRKPSETPIVETDSSSDDQEDSADNNDDDDGDFVTDQNEASESVTEVSPEDRELRELEDQQVRLTNAYPGAINSIGSIHQRRWYLSMERIASGLIDRRDGRRVPWHLPATSKETGVTSNPRASLPFYVHGRDSERSIITGRLGADILRDEGVQGFVPRMGWSAVLE